MLKPQHNTNPTAHLSLATWLYTTALHDPRAKIIALVAVSDEDETQTPKPHSLIHPSTPEPAPATPPGNNPPKKPHARVIGVAWLQHFLPHEKDWSTRYPTHLPKTKQAIPIPHLIIDTKAYARVLKLLYSHRETCVGEQGGWYIRNIAAESDGAIFRLLEYAGEMFGRGGRDENGRDRNEVVFWQAPPFRKAAGLYERMGWRWGMCGGRVVEGGEGC